MRIKITQKLQPGLLQLFRELQMNVQYAYATITKENYRSSLSIRIETIGVSYTDMKRLSEYANFIVCPHGRKTVELYTFLPENIKRCII